MKRSWTLLLIGSALATSSFSSCAQSPNESQVDFTEPAAVESDVAPDIDQVPTALEVEQASELPGERPQTTRPQLTKRAYLTLGVTSIEDSFGQVRQIIQKQQGDLLSLQDSSDRQRSLSLELRVPQERLDATLDDFTVLGEVRGRSISTEDVSSQIVDLQARLKNARKSEEALLELMGRTGEISDILEVSKELSNVRQTIEQMAAQQQNLQTKVRYSTITLELESAITITSDQPALSRQLANSWQLATHSVGSFTTNLLQIGLWLFAYSPYLVVLLCGAAIVKKVRLADRS
ncbi:hypothetical protein S7335_2021 [Synechococcus sp. PCC 7335]|uniref:DUF4349 domain-containing protein n=1 Tax=Synechococcus sp. (strain ATCC 29403 / PCC 7335) TaxID=91464 RepID=UPI00017EE02A|nr:DUF4349 domain-containing protein [Synechococcus sp. PCC 7335]EDX84324.1 hypothetical protein S7335_2021 [Synechococcus sp. PCC 7335]